MSDNVKSGLFNVLRRWTLVISKQVEADIKTYLQLLLDHSNALSLSLPAHYCAIWMSLPFSSSSVIPLSFVLSSLILFEFFSCRCYLFASLPHPSVCVPPPRISHLSILSCNPSPLSAPHPSPFVCFMPPRSLQCHSFDSFFFLEFIPGWLACCELSFWQPINYFTQTREQVGDFCIFDTFFLQNIYIRFKKPEHCVKPASRFNHIRDIWKSYCICSNMLGESWKQCNEKLQKVMATCAAFEAPSFS